MLTEAPPQPRRAIGRRVPLPTDPRLTLEVLGRPLFAIVVEQEPATQGSKDFKGMRQGKPVLVESSEAKLRPWRAKVAAAAVAARPATWDVLDGPLVADMVFSLPRLSRTPKTLRVVPDTKPDLDKLAMATGDALCTDTAALRRPIMAEDSRITDYRRLTKVFAGDPLDPDALRVPGAVIRLWRYPEDLLGKVGRHG